MIIYGQRTLDGRIAFGGRGAPYHFGSAVRPAYDSDVPAVHTPCARPLSSSSRPWPRRPLHPRLGWPARHSARLAFLGRLRPGHGLAWAGGYVGDGVSTTNLAGRTLADLITGADTG
jgi:glycine/D-amino acid oxidase-like deaminating enzyme